MSDPLVFEGNCWKFGDNIPTDEITPTFVVWKGFAEMAKHDAPNDVFAKFGNARVLRVHGRRTVEFSGSNPRRQFRQELPRSGNPFDIIAPEYSECRKVLTREHLHLIVPNDDRNIGLMFHEQIGKGRNRALALLVPLMANLRRNLLGEAFMFA